MLVIPVASPTTLQHLCVLFNADFAAEQLSTLPCEARSSKAERSKKRFATFGLMYEANLDEGAMWPTAFALKKLAATKEGRIGALVKKAVGVI
jgi:hypothetical protein